MTCPHCGRDVEQERQRFDDAVDALLAVMDRVKKRRGIWARIWARIWRAWQ